MSQESMGLVADLVLDHLKYTEFLESKTIPNELEGISIKGLKIFKEIIVGTRAYLYRDIFNPNINFDQWDQLVQDFSQTRIVNSLNDGDLPQYLDYLLEKDIFSTEDKNNFIVELMNYSIKLTKDSNSLEVVSSLGGETFSQEVFKHKMRGNYFILFFQGASVQVLQIDQESFEKFHSEAAMTQELSEFFIEWEIL